MSVFSIWTLRLHTIEYKWIYNDMVVYHDWCVRHISFVGFLRQKGKGVKVQNYASWITTGFIVALNMIIYTGK